jgi:hypothetical protein
VSRYRTRSRRRHWIDARHRNRSDLPPHSESLNAERTGGRRPGEGHDHRRPGPAGRPPVDHLSNGTHAFHLTVEPVTQASEPDPPKIATFNRVNGGSNALYGQRGAFILPEIGILRRSSAWRLAVHVSPDHACGGVNASTIQGWRSACLFGRGPYFCFPFNPE